jgi:hypothetical protein
VERNLGRHLLETLLRFADVGEGVLGQGEVVPAIALDVAAYGEEVLAFHVRREEANAEFLGERQDAILRRADPLPANLDYRTVRERVVQDAPADAVSGLQQKDRKSGCHKVTRGD